MQNLVFFISGCVSVAAQTFLLREIQLIFHGNELSIGLVLFLWMLGAAFGSFASAWASEKSGPARAKRLLALTFLAAGPYVMLSLYCIREIPGLAGLLPGIQLPLGYLVFFASAVFIPMGALMGAQFSLGVRWLQGAGAACVSGRVYLWETLGFFAGGAAYTLGLLFGVNSILTAAVILQVSALAAALLLNDSRQKLMAAAFIAVFIPVIVFSGKLEKAGMERVFSGYRVAEVTNTPYGQLAAASRRGELFLFSDGAPVETFNKPDAETVENNVILPLLFRPKPSRVLLIGGAGRYISAIEAGGAEELDYVELNPWLTGFASRNFGSPAAKGKTKLNIINEDGRRYAAGTSKKYDAVFVDMPLPATLAVNRYYTEEFFRSARGLLAPGGIFVISLPGSMDSVDRYLGGLTAQVLGALNRIFGHVRVIPGASSVFICGAAPFPGIEKAVKEFRGIRGGSIFVSEKYIRYKLDPEKEKWFLERTANFSGVRPGNRDLYPAGLFRSLVYRQSFFSAGGANAYVVLSKYIWAVVLLAAGWLFFKRGYTGTAFTAGAAAMGMQMISIWGMQVLNGAVYYWLGLLTACFMAGTGLAAFAAISNFKSQISNALGKYVKLTDALMIAWMITWFVLLNFIGVPWYLLFILSAGSGILLGLQFPLLAPAEAAFRGTDEASVSGMIYGADLLGGCFAALIGGALIIPAWGLSGMAAMLFLLKVSSLRR